MVADVNDDIEAEPTLCDDRVVQSVKEDRHQGFEVGTLATRTQTDPREQSSGRDAPGEGIYPEAEPRAIERNLDGRGDGGLA
jgi:hypothetical protein